MIKGGETSIRYFFVLVKIDMERFREKYIGSKAFYLQVLTIAVPMIIQNLITNFVSMLDNIMVGQVGTLQMSGVSIVNQFIFVFNITVFGGVSGASIFGTQFFGKKDYEGQKYTFRFRLFLTAIVIVLGILIFEFWGDILISLFLSKDDSPQMIADTLRYGKEYLSIIVVSLIPFGIGQAYTSAVRECGETRVPMIGSMAAIGVNLVLDYGLIFGKLGMPEMGVIGAAIATLIAKIVEAGVIILWTHTHKKDFQFIVGLFQDFFYIPAYLVKDIIVKGCPLLVNEFLWSIGMSVVAQCYSVRGLEVVAARNIASTIVNLFGVIYIQFGATIGIIVGARLGAGLMKEARETTTKLMLFTFVVTSIVALVLIPVGIYFPEVYRTEASVKQLASFYIIVQALCMPIWSYTNACYFVLRSGGKTLITFIFDFTFTWFLMIPLAYGLTWLTNMDIHLIFILVTFTEIIKAIIGYFLVRSDLWMVNIVNQSEY